MNYPDKMIAIILAAGKASRFGSNKLLASFNETTVIENVINQLPKNIQKIYIITGHYHSELVEGLSNYECEFIYNENYEKGKFTSMHFAMDIGKKEKANILLTLGDLPNVSEKDYLKLVNNFKLEKNTSIFSEWDDIPRPPVVVSYNEIKDLEFKNELRLKEILSDYKTIKIKNSLYDIDRVSDISN